jgi:hypothetical protein
LQDTLQRAVHVGHEFVVRRSGRRREGPYYGQAAGRQVGQPGRHDSAQAALNPVPQNRVSHRFAHHESDASRLGIGRLCAGGTEQMDHHRAPTSAPTGSDGATEVVGPAEPIRRGQHGVVTVTSGCRPGGSRRQALTTLAAAGGEDRATRTGTHPKTEAVLLVPATVVRLERPLAHWNDSGYSRSR